MVLAVWERAVRHHVAGAAGFTPVELRDAMPQVVDHLVDVLVGGASGAACPVGQTSEHGTRRFHQRYAAADLLLEYQLLRQAILGQAGSELGAGPGLTVADVSAVTAAVDAVARAAVAAFADAQRAHLQRAAEVEATFLSYLAHDQRNHLNHALLLLELHSVELGQYPELAQSAADLQEVREAIRRTTRGMERLMQAERLRREAVAADRQPVVPAEVVRGVVAAFAAEATAKGLRVESDVPAGGLTSDPALIGLALTNLVGNAIKFSPAGVVRVSAGRADGRDWWFAVADQGPGIAADGVGQLFDAFVRGQTHGQGGMGLGLSIASQAARLLGGRLGVESTVGVGSTFTLTVPHG